MTDTPIAAPPPKPPRAAPVFPQPPQRADHEKPTRDYTSAPTAKHTLNTHTPHPKG